MQLIAAVCVQICSKYLRACIVLHYTYARWAFSSMIRLIISFITSSHIFLSVDQVLCFSDNNNHLREPKQTQVKCRAEQSNDVCGVMSCHVLRCPEMWCMRDQLELFCPMCLCAYNILFSTYTFILFFFLEIFLIQSESLCSVPPQRTKQLSSSAANHQQD